MSVDGLALPERTVTSENGVRNRRLVLLAAVVAVTVFLLAIRTVEEARLSARALGVDMEETAVGLSIASVYPGTPAETAGLMADDRLVKVAGRVVTELAEYDAAALTYVPGGEVDLRIERGGEPMTLQITPGRPFPWIRMVTECLACLGYLALGAVALLQLPGELRARLLMLFSFAVAIELAAPTDLFGLPDLADVSYPLLALLVGFQIGTELHLAASIPDRRRWHRRRRWLVPAFYVAGLGVGALYAASLVADSAGWTVLPWSFETAELLYWNVAMPLWAVGVVALLALPAFRWPDPLGRQQALLVLLAGVPWTVLTLSLTVADVVGVGYPEWVYTVEPLVLLVYPLAVFVAIFRYQLFDLEFVVKRSLVYGCLTGLLILIFYGVLAAGGVLISPYFPDGRASAWVIGCAMLVMGLLFAPLRRAVQRAIDRQFFPERAALRQHLIGLAEALPALGSLPAMGRELAGKLCSIFGLEWAAVLLGGESGVMSPLASAGLPDRADELLLISGDDPGLDVLRRAGRPHSFELIASRSPALTRRLESLRVAILVPLVREEQLVGLLVLGRKVDGRPFPAEEVELLNLLAHHVATAFEYSQLFESATRDGLTGLLRREAVLAELTRELGRSRRFARPLAICMADIDRFKEINDRHGHLKGDVMMRRVAETIQGGLRGTDVVGRYGGEEFLIVLPETDLEGAHVVAEKLRERVEEVHVDTDDGEDIRVTISIGVAGVEQFPDRQDTEVNDLIATADEALYHAKSGGRNRVELRAAAR